MYVDALIRFLKTHNAQTSGPRVERDRGPEWATELDAANTRLAVYGSLAPGQINHHYLQPLTGVWMMGSVRGRLFDAGWGSNVGFPGFIWDETGGPVPVQLFVSAELNQHWERLDRFEGEDYKRILVPVYLTDKVVVGNIYAVASDGGGQ